MVYYFFPPIFSCHELTEDREQLGKQENKNEKRIH